MERPGRPDAALLARHGRRGRLVGRKTEGLWTVVLCGSEACVRAFAAWAAGICGTTAKPYYRTGCWYISISGRHQVPKLVRALYADAPVSLDRKQETADRILAAEEPRRKPGPLSTFTSEQEKRAHYRKSGRERQRRYMEKKRRQTDPRRPA